jgi:hypothetical protein
VLGTFRTAARDAVSVLSDVIAKQTAKDGNQRDGELLKNAQEALTLIRNALKTQEK